MSTEEDAGLQVTDVAEPLYRVKGWIKFFCIAQIIAAALQLVGGVLLLLKMNLLGIFYLFLGCGIVFTVTQLYPAICFIEDAYEKESEDDLLDSAYAIASYLKSLGILCISSAGVFIAIVGLVMLL